MVEKKWSYPGRAKNRGVPVGQKDVFGIDEAGADAHVAVAFFELFQFFQQLRTHQKKPLSILPESFVEQPHCRP